MVLSDQARAYKKEIYLRALVAKLKMVPREADCAVTLRWFRSRKSGDLDNRIKIVLDALQGTAYEQDSQVSELHAFRLDDPKNPRLEISVERAA
jgi:crossover junction endodeoxyribonuclease RusA